ncbi:ribonuclease P protein subunit p40-like [Dipodomys spectabilis]|uniref:ribonuclease P protein subunit p40-like n=1 Tax=Dipodomys spectabilis TaxID=105255 RepID=UPI001C53F698|nr:ribonuclease P protein subunit p40-like [Dipodomys spectabilis]
MYSFGSGDYGHAVNALRGARHLLVCEKSNFSHHKSCHRHIVEAHYHNYQVSFLIPECGILPKELKTWSWKLDPITLKILPLHELITHEFINTFIRKSSCYALTFNIHIDEDTVGLLPNGKLILSLDKDTYEETGLQGHPSQYSGRKIRKFSAIESTMMSYFSKYQIQKHHPKVELNIVNHLQCPVSCYLSRCIKIQLDFSGHRMQNHCKMKRQRRKDSVPANA